MRFPADAMSDEIPHDAVSCLLSGRLNSCPYVPQAVARSNLFDAELERRASHVEEPGHLRPNLANRQGYRRIREEIIQLYSAINADHISCR
jgi:hypothetical protein